MAGQLILLGLVVVLSLPRLPHLAPVGAAGWAALVGGVAALAAAAAVIAGALRDLGPSLTPLPRPRDGAILVETGIYARIRHPIYGGLVLASVGWSAVTGSLPSLAVAFALAILLDAKARREERWLADHYPSYEAYRARTRRFLPGVY